MFCLEKVKFVCVSWIQSALLYERVEKQKFLLKTHPLGRLEAIDQWKIDIVNSTNQKPAFSNCVVCAYKMEAACYGADRSVIISHFKAIYRCRTFKKWCQLKTW